MFNEVQAENPGLHVEVLGVNRTDSAPDNFYIAQMLSVLPWLQDTAQQSVWFQWGVTYRDVVLLDAFNRPVAPNFNLTVHDLANPTNFATLKKSILSLATPVDSDKDGLPDDWEKYWFGSLAPMPGGDNDHDGFDNRTELAFGTDPSDPASKPLVHALIARPAGLPVLAATFHRFAGGLVDFVVETSPDMKTWSADPSLIFRSGSVRNACDGKGGADVRFQLTTKSATQPEGFIRVTPIFRSVSP